MAVKTGAIFKTLTFDGVNSGNYGVYITGAAVFNAPTRRVNLIEIPGRNGLFAQDEGTFDNITVSYPAGLFGIDEADFADAISDFRNELCSRVGYKELTDDYNGGEYRQAVYTSGLEVTPIQLKAGEFALNFECKPQRWLNSGKSLASVANNGTVTNPTLFDAAPLFEIKGYGQITLTKGTESQVFSIASQDVGNVTVGESLARTFRPQQSITATQTLDLSALNTGNAITIPTALFQYSVFSDSLSGTATAVSITNSTGNASAYISGGSIFNFDFGSLLFVKGTSATKTHSARLTYSIDGGLNKTKDVTITVAFNGSSSVTVTATTCPVNMSFRAQLSEATGYSTKQSGGTTYIDCETGLCWADMSGTLVSANSYVSLPAKLPSLGANGATTVTYSNTITSFKCAPRWWKI